MSFVLHISKSFVLNKISTVCNFLVHYGFTFFRGCNFRFLSDDMLAADSYFGADIKHYEGLSFKFVNQDDKDTR